MESTAELTPSLDKLYQTFPNCEKDLIPVPKPNDEATQNILSHHKTFKELSKGKQTGFFFPDLRKLLSRTPESQEENPDSNSKPKSHGCIYVPMPLSGNAFLYKNISSVKQNTQQLIVDSLEDQLKFLDEHLDASICLNLLLIFKNKNSENLFDEVKSALQNTCSYQHLRLEFTYCIENEQKRLRRENQPLEGLTKFLMKILATEESSDQSIEYTLSGKMFKHLGGDSFTLREHDKVLNLFKIYFNNFETKLEIVPDCDRILDSLLYSTDKDAQLKHNSSKYLGEVKWFLESLVPELKSATGILLKDWGKNSFNNLLSPSSLYNVDFQLDYLFCTKSNLIAFEVGMTQNFSLPKSALRNKLGQSIAKILPTMKFVAATLLQQAPNSWFNSSGETSDKQKTIETFIKKNVKVVVYIPNASIQGFEEAFNELKHQLNTCPESLSQIFFLLHEHENDSKNIVMRRVNSDLEICQVDYPQQVFEISDDASHQAVGISRDSLPAVEYLFALIVFGNLILNDRREISSLDTAALGVDDRYQLAQDAFLKNQEDPSGQQPYFLNLILSPQQHSILSENKTRVWLRGEPGSGKTALLLAKAIQEAKKEEIDVVIFAVPESTTLLYDFVEKELKRLKTEATADWWKKIDLLRFKRVWEPIRYKHLRKHAPRHTRNALLIDELNSLDLSTIDQDWKKIFDQTSVLWVAEVITDEEMKLPESFELYDLTVLYRSSHHISELSSRLIHDFKDVSSTTPVVHGCHTSSQKKVAIDLYSDDEDGNQLMQKVEKMLNSKFSEARLFICIHGGDKILEKLKKVENVHFVNVLKTKALSFSGYETQSVVVIIDENCNLSPLKKVLILAVSRAQYEVGILVHNDCPGREYLFEQMYLQNLPGHLELYANLKSNNQFTIPVNISKQDLYKFIRNVNKILSVQECSIISRQLPTATQPTHADNNGLADKHDLILVIFRRSSALERDHFQTLKPMLNGMDDPAICKSLKAMKDLLNDTTLEKAKDLLGLNHCNKACSQMVQMFFQTFFLFELCQSGTTDELRSILELLEEKNELQTCLNVKSPQTLLTAVCSSNLDSQVQVEHARVLFDKGFPKKLLLHRLNKSNKIRYTALEWAIKRVNPQLVDLILCDEERKRLFLAEERRTNYLTDLASKSKRNAEVESSNPESTEASNALDIFNQLKRITGNDL